MPQIIDNAPEGWQDILNQSGYQKPAPAMSIQNGRWGSTQSVRPPQILPGQIPEEVAVNPNSPRGQLHIQARRAGYVPKGQQTYGPREMGVTPQQIPQRQSLPFDPNMLTRTDRPPVSTEQRAKVAEHRTERQQKLQESKDQRLRDKLATMDPRMRAEREKRIDANRAKRGLGPISGPKNTGEFIGVESFTGLDSEHFAEGQPVMLPSGQRGVVGTQFGETFVTPLRQDETGRLVPDVPPTIEEKRETEEHEVKMADIRSRTSARGNTGLTVKERVQAFDWDTEMDDLYSDILLYQDEIDLVNEEVATNKNRTPDDDQREKLLKFNKQISDARARQRAIIAERGMAEMQRDEDARQLQDRQDLAVAEEELRTGKPKEEGVPMVDFNGIPMPAPRTPEEAMSLPPGTTFITPDGKLKAR